MLPHLLNNFEIQKYQNEPRFNVVFSRNNLPYVMGRTYLINRNECNSFGTRWIALYVNCDKVAYFDIFRAEYIPKEIKKLINNKSITTNVCRIQAYDSIMCGCFFIGFINFMRKGKVC